GALVGTPQFLRQFTDLQTGRPPDFAVIGHLIALDQAQHARLPGAVTTDDAGPLATGNLPGHLVQQRHGAVGPGNIGELEQGHDEHLPNNRGRLLSEWPSNHAGIYASRFTQMPSASTGIAQKAERDVLWCPAKPAPILFSVRKCHARLSA